MAKKIEKNLEGKTLVQYMDMLKDTVQKHNDTKDAHERAKLKIEADKIVEAYNITSLQTAYANVLEQENPMLAFIKKYQYPVVKVGTSKETSDLEVKDSNTKGEPLTEVFNLWDFVAYCEDLNKQVTVALDWKSKAAAACEILKTQVQEYNDNGTPMGVIKLQTAIQAMFDSIVKVTTPTGKNAVIVKAKEIRIMQTSCGSMDVKKFVAKYASAKTWQKQTFALLHGAVEGKEFTCIYGDPDDEKKTETTTEEKTEE